MSMAKKKSSPKRKVLNQKDLTEVFHKNNLVNGSRKTSDSDLTESNQEMIATDINLDSSGSDLEVTISSSASDDGDSSSDSEVIFIGGEFTKTSDTDRGKETNSNVNNIKKEGRLLLTEGFKTRFGYNYSTPLNVITDFHNVRGKSIKSKTSPKAAFKKSSMAGGYRKNAINIENPKDEIGYISITEAFTLSGKMADVDDNHSIKDEGSCSESDEDSSYESEYINSNNESDVDETENICTCKLNDFNLITELRPDIEYFSFNTNLSDRLDHSMTVLGKLLLDEKLISVSDRKSSDLKKYLLEKSDDVTKYDSDPEESYVHTCDLEVLKETNPTEYIDNVNKKSEISVKLFKLPTLTTTINVKNDSKLNEWLSDQVEPIDHLIKRMNLIKSSNNQNLKGLTEDELTRISIYNATGVDNKCIKPPEPRKRYFVKKSTGGKGYIRSPKTTTPVIKPPVQNVKPRIKPGPKCFKKRVTFKLEQESKKASANNQNVDELKTLPKESQLENKKEAKSPPNSPIKKRRRRQSFDKALVAAALAEELKENNNEEAALGVETEDQAKVEPFKTRKKKIQNRQIESIEDNFVEGEEIEGLTLCFLHGDIVPVRRSKRVAHEKQKTTTDSVNSTAEEKTENDDSSTESRTKDENKISSDQLENNSDEEIQEKPTKAELDKKDAEMREEVEEIKKDPVSENQKKTEIDSETSIKNPDEAETGEENSETPDENLNKNDDQVIEEEPPTEKSESEEKLNLINEEKNSEEDIPSSEVQDKTIGQSPPVVKRRRRKRNNWSRYSKNTSSKVSKIRDRPIKKDVKNEPKSNALVKSKIEKNDVQEESKSPDGLCENSKNEIDESKQNLLNETVITSNKEEEKENRVNNKCIDGFEKESEKNLEQTENDPIVVKSDEIPVNKIEPRNEKFTAHEATRVEIVETDKNDTDQTFSKLDEVTHEKSNTVSVRPNEPVVPKIDEVVPDKTNENDLTETEAPLAVAGGVTFDEVPSPIEVRAPGNSTPDAVRQPTKEDKLSPTMCRDPRLRARQLSRDDELILLKAKRLEEMKILNSKIEEQNFILGKEDETVKDDSNEIIDLSDEKAGECEEQNETIEENEPKKIEVKKKRKSIDSELLYKTPLSDLHSESEERGSYSRVIQKKKKNQINLHSLISSNFINSRDPRQQNKNIPLSDKEKIAYDLKVQLMQEKEQFMNEMMEMQKHRDLKPIGKQLVKHPYGHSSTYNDDQIYPNSEQQIYPNSEQQIYPNSEQQIYPNSEQQIYPNSEQQNSAARREVVKFTQFSTSETRPHQRDSPVTASNFQMQFARQEVTITNENFVSVSPIIQSYQFTRLHAQEMQNLHSSPIHIPAGIREFHQNPETIQHGLLNYNGGYSGQPIGFVSPAHMPSLSANFVDTRHEQINTVYQDECIYYRQQQQPLINGTQAVLPQQIIPIHQSQEHFNVSEEAIPHSLNPMHVDNLRHPGCLLSPELPSPLDQNGTEFHHPPTMPVLPSVKPRQMIGSPSKRPSKESLKQTDHKSFPSEREYINKRSYDYNNKKIDDFHRRDDYYSKDVFHRRESDFHRRESGRERNYYHKDDFSRRNYRHERESRDRDRRSTSPFSRRISKEPLWNDSKDSSRRKDDSRSRARKHSRSPSRSPGRDRSESPKYRRRSRSPFYRRRSRSPSYDTPNYRYRKSRSPEGH